MIGCTAVCVGFAAAFGYRYGIRPVIDPSTAAYVNSIRYDTIRDSVLEGSYIDRNGNVILSADAPGNRVLLLIRRTIPLPTCLGTIPYLLPRKTCMDCVET